VNLGPVLVGADGLQFLLRYFHRQVHIAKVAYVDHRGTRASCTHQKLSQFVEWFLCCRQADADRPLRGERRQSLERKRQVRSALIAGYCMDFIDDYRLDVAEDLSAPRSGKQEVEGFRSGDQNMRWPAKHLLPLFGRSV